MAQRKPIKESPSPSASTRKASSTRYDTQFNPVDTTKGIVKGLGQALFNAGTGRNGGIVGVGKGVVQSFAGTASRVDDYAVRALNATGIKKATNVELQTAKRNTYGYETGDLLNIIAAKGGAKSAGKVVQTTAGAVVKTGLPARIVNSVRGDIVVVHGTGKPIVGNTINPRAGSAYSPTEPAAFAWNTQHGSGKTGGQNWMHQALQEYTNRPYINAKGVSVPGERNIVIGKTQMKDAFPDLSSKSVIASKKPIKITKVIKEEPIGAKIYEQQKNFIQELKRAGVKVEPNAAQRAFSKIEAARLAKRYRLRNENSPV